MLRSVSGRLATVLRLLEAHLDVIEGRVTCEEPPAWCTRRGLDAFLLGLSTEDLEQCERVGLARWVEAQPDAPEPLACMAAEVRACTALGPPRVTAPPRPTLDGASGRKRAQLGAWYEALTGPGGMLGDRAHRRVVDLGSGRGHLTRWAARTMGLPALGVDREAAHVERARSMEPIPTVRFDRRDALADPIALDAADLAVGLHACGDLGDALLDAARRASCDVVLVPCCLQKTAAGSWRPRSAEGRRSGVRISRGSLGLANTTPHERGVEVPMSETMAAREARFALRLLLESRGVGLEPGEEMRGINRRRARRGLPVLADLAFARRGLPSPSAAELSWAGEEGRTRHARVRRLSLPRSMFARAVEVAHALDRACALQEEGFEVEVFPLVGQDVTPRNLTIVGLARRRVAPVERTPNLDVT